MSSYLLVSTISFTLSILQCNRPAAMNLESSLRERKKRLLNNTPPRKYRPTSIGCAVTKHHGHLLLKYMQYVFIRCLIHSHLVKAWTQNKHHHSCNPNTSCLSIFFSSQNLTLPVKWVSSFSSAVQTQRWHSGIKPIQNSSWCKYCQFT